MRGNSGFDRANGEMRNLRSFSRLPQWREVCLEDEYMDSEECEYRAMHLKFNGSKKMWERQNIPVPISDVMKDN